MNRDIFCGGIPALMTPCNADRTPSTAALVKKGQELIAAGMNAVVYCGSMGDWPLLTDTQRQTGVKALVDADVPVIVGTGAVNSQTAIAHAAHAQEIGAKGLMVIPRLLSRGTSPAAQRDHFAGILGAAPDLPAVIYNSPYYALRPRRISFSICAANSRTSLASRNLAGPRRLVTPPSTLPMPIMHSCYWPAWTHRSSTVT